MLLSSYLDNDTINFKIFPGSTSKAIADGEKKWKAKTQKIEYLENKKSFLDEIKNIFHRFLKGYRLVKNKNLRKNSRHKL